MQFDDILRELGEFGTYQKRIYFLICIPSIVTGFHLVISVFLIATPNHRCMIPGYPNDTYEIQSDYHRQLINLTIPGSTDDNLEYDQCEIYDRSGGQTGDNVTRIPCTSWVYATDVMESSFTTEQNMVCKDRLKATHTQMIYFAGVLIGSFMFGTFSDTIGRKKTLYIALLLMIMATFGTAWAPEFFSFCVLRFFVGMACAGIFMTTFVIGLELVGPSKRVFTGIVVMYFYGAGLVILAGLAYWLRHWKYLEIACSIPTVAFLFYWWLLPESPRWLVSQRRFEEADKIIQRAAKVNKVTVSKTVLYNMSTKDKPAGRVWELFTSRILMTRTLIIFFNWMVVSMVYYGLSLNSGNLGGDFYLNFLISGLVEFPAYTLCLMFLDVTGRRMLHAGCMIVGGAACICTIFTLLYASESLQPITVALAMLGKLGIAAAFAVIYVWSAEIFPTVVRNAGMGASSTCARIGGMVAPYIANSSKVIEGDLGRAIPLVIFGVASVVAGILSIFLPETLHQNLPETIEDSKTLRKRKQPIQTNLTYATESDKKLLETNM